MKRIPFDQDQIKCINRIYHDFEADIYTEYHPEIEYETGEWERLGQKYFARDQRLTVLDVGTGNGFVPSVVGKHLKEKDTIICSDISENMLMKAEEKLATYPQLEKIFIKADALMLSTMDIKADIITMNSVLHHLPDYDEVLKGLAGLLKENGLFIIMHERNQKFCRDVPFFMKLCLLLIEMNKLMRKSAGTVLSALGLYSRRMARDELYTKVGRAIREQGICDRILTVEEINSLVDLHDPDEGGEGFDPFVLHQEFFNDFVIVELFSHMHLGPWTDIDSSSIKKGLSKFLENRYPYSGAVFGLVVRKMA